MHAKLFLFIRFEASHHLPLVGSMRSLLRGGFGIRTVQRRFEALDQAVFIEGFAEEQRGRRHWRWDQVDFERGMLHVRRVKNGTPSMHPLGGSEIRALRRLRREQPESRHVFLTERRSPMSPAGFRKLIARTGEGSKFPFSVHPHMLRHACGYKLANDGQDTRALQHHLGHKNIQHTVRYTELSPERFKSFWED